MPPDRRDGSLLPVDLVRRNRECADRFKRPFIRRGVAPLFNLTGPASLYVDRQGTQGFMYTPGLNFESYNFRNPTTGQAWSGAVMTLGPQLSIGLIQGANQPGNAIVLPGPPRVTPPLVDIQSTILDDIP